MTIDLCIWTSPVHLFFCRRGYKMLQKWRKFFKIPRKALENPMLEIECSHLKNSWQARWIICMPSLSLMSSLLFAGATGTESDRWVNAIFWVKRQRYPRDCPSKFFSTSDHRMCSNSWKTEKKIKHGTRVRQLLFPWVLKFFLLLLVF